MSPQLTHRGTLEEASPVLDALERFVAREVGTGGLILVAFSAGPDSTALLWGLARVAPRLGVELHAAHLDHCLDPDSRRRADAARRLAAAIGVRATVKELERRPSGAGTQSLEAFARRHRYAFLDRLADHLGARCVATAHHADDQAETVLLRILFGSGLEGLGAMRHRRGRLARPLLALRRRELLRAVEAAGLEGVHDPTNLDLSVPRNAVRSRLLPLLEAEEPGIVEGLCRLAAVAQRAGDRIERRLERLLSPRPLRLSPAAEPHGAEIDRRAFESLPDPLRQPALALLHRRAGAPYPAGAAARRELRRQLAAGSRIGCDCGRGWRWEGDSAALRLAGIESPPGDFAYNLSVPGSVDVPELRARVRLTPRRVESWMFRGDAKRAGLAVTDLEGQRVLVRNRRSGDRIQPLGSCHRLKLKDLLIDRRVPRRERDRLPLLVIDDEIAWVPGVTIAERFRLADGTTAWVAELTSFSDRTNHRQLRRGHSEAIANGGSRER